MKALQFICFPTVFLCVLAMPHTASAEHLEGIRKAWHQINPYTTYLTPTFSINGGYSSETLDPLFDDSFHFSMWSGLELHPMAGATSPYVAFGIETEFHDTTTGGEAVYFMPMARAGVSWTQCLNDETSYLSTMFPCLSIYGIGGLRPASPNREVAMRLGLGIKSPFITFLGLGASIALPSHYEFIVESSPGSYDEPIFIFRIGLGI